MRYLFIHRTDYNNPGDLWSSPLHYLPRSCSGAVVDIHRLPYIHDWNVDAVVVGGGALLHRAEHLDSLMRFLGHNDWQTFTVWGAGVDISLNFRQLRHKTDLFGMREYDARYLDHWLPCASVMHPLIAQSRRTRPKHDLLIIDHWKRKPIKVTRPCTRITNNPQTMKTMIDAMAEHRWVITSSYHGVYWATLMNRRVIFCSRPWVPKVIRMRHPPLITSDLNDDDLDCSVNYPWAYEECLERNREFKTKFLELTSP